MSTNVDKLVHIFDVHLIPSDTSDEVHEAQRCDHPIVLVFFAFRKFANAEQELEEEIHGVQELANMGLELFVEG